MVFINCLNQSLIITSIFYGGCSATMGEVNRPVLRGIAA
jgi:hypothetical protein